MLEHKKVFFIKSILFLSILFGQRISNIALLDKDGAQYDLSQKMSINMQESDIKNVLMLIGELTGLNIVVSPSVKDTITANLENVSVKAVCCGPLSEPTLTQPVDLDQTSVLSSLT